MQSSRAVVPALTAVGAQGQEWIPATQQRGGAQSRAGSEGQCPCGFTPGLEAQPHAR